MLVEDLPITVCVLPVLLLPATILAKNDLFSEQFNVIKLCLCAPARFACSGTGCSTSLYGEQGCGAVTSQASCLPCLFLINKEGVGIVRAVTRHASLAQGLFFSFLMEELKVLLVVEKAATGILEDLVQALLDSAE